MQTASLVVIGGVSLSVTSAQRRPPTALCHDVAGEREDTRKKQKRTV